MSIGSESSGPSNTSQDQRSDDCQGNRCMMPHAEISSDRCNDTSCDNPGPAGPCDRQPQFKLRPHRRRSKPRTVEELLSRLSLQHLISVFLHNGYETLDLFSDLEEADLDMLNISNTEDRARILTAAQMLQGYSEVDEPVEKTELCSVSSHSTPSVSSGDSAYYASPSGQLRQLEKSSTNDVVYDTNRPGKFARGNGRTLQSADVAAVHVCTNGDWCNGAMAFTSESSNGMPSYRVQVATATDRGTTKDDVSDTVSLCDATEDFDHDTVPLCDTTKDINHDTVPLCDTTEDIDHDTVPLCDTTRVDQSCGRQIFSTFGQNSRPLSTYK
ncbi:hypothetical protein NP493_582g00017 [Ridgeia piscesae]|uniref:SAM domain-containing protein n=1 Tax=Ridgeia piscesae TaxID=27915 RepID=A0AAD9KUM5_RIDPI|nr:hypothetical protein NP493_582g00017 [Ridgeia piscesae]